MADINVGINRDFLISGSLSGQAYRLAVKTDTTAYGLVRGALRDFLTARTVEQSMVDGLQLFEEELKSVRKDLAKVNKRRIGGVPNSGLKQQFVVRTMASSLAFRSAVMVDQIQRDLVILSMDGNPNVARAVEQANSRILSALSTIDAVISDAAKKAGGESRRRNASTSRGKDPQSSVPSPGKEKAKGKEQGQQVKSTAEKAKPTKKSPAEKSNDNSRNPKASADKKTTTHRPAQSSETNSITSKPEAKVQAQDMDASSSSKSTKLVNESGQVVQLNGQTNKGKAQKTEKGISKTQQSSGPA